jgi:hypothetical protein
MSRTGGIPVVHGGEDVKSMMKAHGHPEYGTVIVWLDNAEGISSAAADLGRRGGRKGGPARTAKLTPERRSEIARNAANARWSKARQQ